MKPTIYKYALGIPDDHNISTVMMPPGARVLTVQVQSATPFLWAMVDADDPLVGPRRFGAYGTGHPMPEDAGSYVGTIQLRGGELVLHVFEAP